MVGSAIAECGVPRSELYIVSKVCGGGKLSYFCYHYQNDVINTYCKICSLLNFFFKVWGDKCFEGREAILRQLDKTLADLQVQNVFSVEFDVRKVF